MLSRSGELLECTSPERIVGVLAPLCITVANAEDVAPRWASVTTEARGGVLSALSVRMIEPPQGAAAGTDSQVHRE